MRVLAEIKLFGERVVPWSPPRSMHVSTKGTNKRHWYHKKDKNLCAWQDSLRAAHRREYGQEPYLGPVMLSMTFVKATEDKALWGKRWWNPNPARGHPDRVNLEKAAEDALKTYRAWHGTGHDRKLLLEIPGVFEDDSQTCDGMTRKRWGPEDGIEITVYALEDS